MKKEILLRPTLYDYTKCVYHLRWNNSVLGKVSKTPVTEIVREGGGVPPLSVNFFPLGFLEPTVREGGGEYPPFPLRKNPLKIGPKTVFFGQKMPFSAKNLRFRQRTVR